MRPFVENVWVKGFRPPSKCPQCNQGYTLILNTLVYTGKYDQHGFHVYMCERCGATVVSPTVFAVCDLSDRDLEEDVFHNPCAKCQSRQTSVLEPICVHFRKRAYTDLRIADKIMQNLMRFKETSKDGRVWSQY